MPAYLLNHQLLFPPPEQATPEGLIAVGGDMQPERLILAYAQGIFPWPHEGMPLLWFSPDPRFVLPLDQAQVSRSLRKRIRKHGFDIRVDTAFEWVIRACAQTPRPGQDGTWITEDLVRGYCQLHEMGYAHSVEAWQDDHLVGGLYGVSLGRAFFGESMFSRVSDASKVATATLLGHLRAWGFAFVDCQVYTEHLARFGAQEWPRSRFLHALREVVSAPTRKGPWRFELSPVEAVHQLLAQHDAARRQSIAGHDLQASISLRVDPSEK